MNYRNCYEILQLHPGANWEELRKSYKHLAQHGHPDRFHGDPDALREAEIGLRQLNAAYKILEDYYRQHNRLPLGSSSHAEWQFQNTSDLKAKEEQFRPQRRVLSFPVSKWLVFAVPAGVVVLAIGFLLAAHSGSEDVESPMPVAEEAASGMPTAAPVPAKRRVFAYGDTWKQVLDIQGDPSEVVGDTWFYGKSQVVFEHGRVTSWSQHDDNPLRVQGETPKTAASNSGRLIQLGDSKEAVLNIQGAPMMKSERRWEYGPSFIEFRDGRVTRWHSSVLRPLAVGEPDAQSD
ncbi:J domain-containing protein [Thiolapillus sp.]